MPAKTPRKYAFVPKLLVRTALASAIPACALATANACGGTTSTPSAKDSGSDQVYTVAAVAYPAYEAGTDSPFTVAAVAYPAYESGAPDGARDAPADATGPDVFGVAAVAYPAYEAGTG